MHTILLVFLPPLVLFLAHYKYVDLWFGRERGLKRYWLEQKSTVATVSKALFLFAILMTCFLVVEDYRSMIAVAVSVAFLGHYGLIALLPRTV